MYAEDRKTVFDRREMLKVKVKSLAAEAKIIRREQQRTIKGGVLWHELRNHRVGPLRDEARLSHLAYGFIRGRALEQMEKTSQFPPDWERVRKMIVKYGPAHFLEPEVMKKAA